MESDKTYDWTVSLFKKGSNGKEYFQGSLTEGCIDKEHADFVKEAWLNCISVKKGYVIKSVRKKDCK